MGQQLIAHIRNTTLKPNVSKLTPVTRSEFFPFSEEIQTDKLSDKTRISQDQVAMISIDA